MTIVLVLSLGLLAVRVWLPTKICEILNASLAAQERNIGGFVEDVDLAIFRGAYRLEGVHLLLLQQKPVPRRIMAVSMDAIDILISWRDLLRGRVRADVDLELPKVALEPLLDFVKAVTKPNPNESRKVSNALVPYKLARVRIFGGNIDSDFLKDGTKPLLEDIEAVATEIFASNEASGATSKIDVVGHAADGGDLSAKGEFKRNSKEEASRWNVEAHLNYFPLSRLNSLLLDLVPLSFTKGLVSVQTVIQGVEMNFKGSVKTTFENVDVISSRERWTGPRQADLELTSAFAFALTKNPGDHSTVATFEFERTQGKFNIHYDEAFRSVIKHRLFD